LRHVLFVDGSVFFAVLRSLFSGQGPGGAHCVTQTAEAPRALQQFKRPSSHQYRNNQSVLYFHSLNGEITASTATSNPANLANNSRVRKRKSSQTAPSPKHNGTDLR
jgi:hypothetical protein